MNESGPHNWLLLRGLGRQSAHWGEFIPQMQRAFPLAQIYTLDLPGSGRLSQQTSPNRIEAIVDIVRQHALEQGMLETPPNLLGLSLGGMVAWQWMQQYPNDMASGVLINSSFASLSPFYQRLRWQNIGTICRLLGSQQIIERELGIVKLISNRSEVEQTQIAQNWAEIDRQQPMLKTTLFSQLQAAACYRPQNAAPCAPVLLLNSLGDRLVSPACSDSIQQHWRLPLKRHPSAGHDLPLDAGDWVTEQLQLWIKERRNNSDL